jgi:hypothetical protein
MYSNRVVMELTAPTGKFRVLGVDVGAEPVAVYVIGDFGAIAAAEQAATQKVGLGGPVFVYNDQSRLITRYGSWHNFRSDASCRARSEGG